MSGHPLPLPSPPQQRAEDFLEILRRAKRGRLKLYIGFAAGVGKTYRMLEEAQALKRRGVEVALGFVETHGRAETEALVGGLERSARTRIEYRGVVIEEMDTAAIIGRRRHRGRRRDRAHQRARQPKQAPLSGRARDPRRRHQRDRRVQHPAPREPERSRRAGDSGQDTRDRARQLCPRGRPDREPRSRRRGSHRAAEGRQDLRRRKIPGRWRTSS